MIDFITIRFSILDPCDEYNSYIYSSVYRVIILLSKFKLSFLSQFVFVYQRGVNTGGDVALDDITVLPVGCYSIDPPRDNSGNLKPS